MRKAREALGVGVEQQDGERDGREPEGEAIQLGSGQNEDGAGDNDEGRDKSVRQMTGGKGAGESAGIGGVDGGIGEAIESHGGGAGREHGDYDPKKLVGGGKTGGGEHGSAEGKWESEDGVLPLDHLESDAEVVKDGHRKIVRQFSVLSSRLSVLSSQFSVVGSQFSVLGSRFSDLHWRSAGSQRKSEWRYSSSVLTSLRVMADWQR